MPVTREQILKAIERLAREGKRPTLERIRAITGGSYSTISPVKKEWEDKQGGAAARPAGATPPEVAKLADEMWAAAQRSANDRLAAEREALAAMRNETEAERDEALALADRLDGELQKARQEVEAARADQMAAREQAARMEGQAETHRKRFDRLMARISRIDVRQIDANTKRPKRD